MNINHLAMLLKYPFYPWYRHDLIKQDIIHIIEHLGSTYHEYRYTKNLGWQFLCIQKSHYDSLGFNKFEDYSEYAGLK